MSRSFVLHEFGKVWQSYVAAYRLYLSSRWWAFVFPVAGAAQVLMYYLLILKYRPPDVYSSGMVEFYAILCLPHLASGLGWWWSRRTVTHVLGAGIVVLTLTLIGAELFEELRLSNGATPLLEGYGWITLLFLLPQCVLALLSFVISLGERFGPKS